MVQEGSSTDKHGSSMFFKDCEFVCPSPVLCPEDLQLAMLDMSSDPWQSLATLNFETYLALSFNAMNSFKGEKVVNNFQQIFFCHFSQRK